MPGACSLPYLVHNIAQSANLARRQRTTLIALLIAAFLAVVGIVLYQGWLGYQDSMAAARTNSLNLSTVIETRLDASLRRAASDLKDLGNGLPDAALNKTSAASLADEIGDDMDSHIRDFPEVSGIRIYNVEGDMLYTSDRKNAPALNVADRSFFVEARNAAPDSLVFSEVIVGRGSGRPTVVLARPLHDGQGVFSGVISASLNFNQFQKVFQSQDIGAQGVIAVFRRDNFTLVTRWPELDAAKPNSALPRGNPAERVFGAGLTRGTAEFAAPFDGIVRVSSFAALDRFPFFVSVGLARDDILADWRKRSLGVGLSGVVLVLVLALLLRRLWRAEARQEQVLTALAESEERARLVLDASMDGAIGLDGDGIVTDWSAGAAVVFGYSREQALGRDFVELIVPSVYRDRCRGWTKRLGETVINHWIGRRIETVAVRADGSEFPIEISISHIRRDGAAFFSAFARDITKLKAAETERVALENRLRQSQKMEAIGKLTGGMAHDFNNYLGVIIGNLDLLADRLDGDAEATKLLNAAMSGAERSAELTQSLLAFSRNQPLAPARIDVSRSLQSVSALLMRALGDDIALTIDLRPDIWPVRVDGAQLDSCIVNLANNARDAMTRGGTLTISARNHPLDALYTSMNMDPGLAPGDYVLIEIADTGTGMPPEAVAHAFEPFYSTKPVGHGTGLGLSMVQGFVKQSHGHISLYSEIDRGTVVRIYLPRDRAEESAPAGADAAVAQDTMPRGSETILVVDDNEAMRHAAVAQLISLGYRTIEAPDGATALAILEKVDEHLDLMLTDVVMPGGLDGFGLERMARMRRPGLKVLLTSGFPEGRMQVNQNAPLSDLLRKPYRLDALARTIRAKLDAPVPLARTA